MENKIAEEQLIYARVLRILNIIGLSGLALTLLVYLAGIISPKISLDTVPQYWGGSVDDYLLQTGLRTGLSWLGLAGYSDFMNFFPLAFLLCITIICYFVIVPFFWKKKDKAYVWFALVQILVLLLAASGMFPTGRP